MDNPSRQDHEYEKRSGGQPNLFFLRVFYDKNRIMELFGVMVISLFFLFYLLILKG
jgi:hypothetical protein